jgi:PAS domain S-box-containing protein
MSGRLWKGEVNTKHKLGHRIPVNISMVAIKKNCIVLGVHGSMEDITKRKPAETALRTSEEKARALLNATTAIALLTDREGIIVAINKAGADKIGKSVDEIIGTCCYDYISPELHESTKAEIDKVLQTGVPTRNERKYEGVIFDQNIYPMFDKNGKVDGISVFLLDITERRRAEEELIESKKELEIKSVDLEEVNTALRVLLRTREKDKKVLEEKVLFSVNDLIMPYMEKLKMSIVDQRHQSYLDIIVSNINDIVSPFMTARATEQYKLTPTQIHVANFIKQGKSTKEIAEILHLSTSTIDSHRNTIRKKLGIANKNVNLRSFLLSRDNS